MQHVCLVVHNLTVEVSNNSYEFLFNGVASKKEKEICDEVSLRSLASS